MLITVMNNKGGIGKSTLAINLARFLARRFGPDNVALVDGDLNATALTWGQLSDGRAELTVSRTDEIPAREVILIDAPGRPTPEQKAALIERSAFVIIPTDPNFESLGATKRMIDATPLRGYAVLLNRVDNQRDPKARLTARAFLERHGVPVLRAEVGARAAFPRAYREGLTVDLLRNNQGARRAWAEIERVGEEILEAINGRQ